MIKRLGLALVLAMLAASSSNVNAGPGGCGNAPWMVPFAFEELDVSSTAVRFTAATAFPDGQKAADLAVFVVEDDAVRYRADGLNPTATVGMLVSANSTGTVCGEESIRKFRVIRVTSDADVSVTYYREGGQ